MDTLNAALDFKRCGISVIPQLYKTKIPAGRLLPQVEDSKSGKTRGTIKPFRERLADDSQIRAWFKNKKLNIGLVLGSVSFGLFVLDFDHDARRSIVEWKEAIGDKLFYELPIVQTSQGFQVYLRYKDVRSTILARNEKGLILVEIKGAGGLTTAPPSVHPSGWVYKWVQHDPTQIPFLNTYEYYLLLGAAAALNRYETARLKPITIRDDIESDPQNPDLFLRRIKGYAQGVLKNLVSDLANQLPGGRNMKLYKAAFVAGRYIGAGYLKEIQVVTLLEEACTANSLIQDDGIHAFRVTLNSGLRNGRERPAQLNELKERFKVEF